MTESSTGVAAGERGDQADDNALSRRIGHGLLGFVTEASHALRAAAEYEDVVRVAGEAVLPVLGDVALVVLTDGGEGRAEVSGADEEHATRDDWAGLARSIAAQAEQRWRRGGARGWWLATTGDAQLRRVGLDRTLAPLLRRLGVTSLLVLPLAAAGHRLGALILVRTEGSPSYSADEFAAAVLLSRRAALAIREARVWRASTVGEARRAGVAEELEKWSHIFEHASWGVALLSGGGTELEAVNPAFALMHGYEQPSELHGLALRELLSVESAARLAARLETADMAPVSFESVHRRRDGSTFPVLVHVASMRDRDGAVVYRALNVQDLSDVKRNEERLHHAQRMEAVGRLAGGVAHEVNNMMTIILGFSDLLSAASDLLDRHRADVDEIRKAALRAAAITQQLLAFSRRQIHQPVVLDLNTVMAETATLLRPLLPADVQVETHLDPVGGAVRADRAQLEQVLINLTFNARDAMPQGGRITLATEFRAMGEGFGVDEVGVRIPPGRYGFLRVTDTGRGMDPATRARIFEPFFTTKAAGQGTGLGLSTVYGIIKQTGGFVWVESAPGWGTTFTVCLPEIESGDKEPGAASPATAKRGGSERILLVEDEEVLRSLTARLLRGQGYQVLEAGHGGRALDLLRSAAPVDLVVTDLVMPDVGGQRLRDGLRGAAPAIPVLFMSAYARRELIDRGLLEPDDPFLQKPFTLEALADRVREILDAVRRR